MGCDATNRLPLQVAEREVGRFLIGLGYVPLRKSLASPFQLHYPPSKPELFEGVWASVSRAEDAVRVWTHTRIWRSKGDSDLHNFTIGELKRRFGGGFTSDYGPNAYLRHPGPDRRDAEALAYAAYAQFEGNLQEAHLRADAMVVRDPGMWQGPISEWIVNPAVAFNHLLLPFLVGLAEEYFRSTWVGLLRFSERKAAIFKGVRFNPDDLAAVSGGILSIEEAAARFRSFQNLGRVAEAFRDIDSRLDLAAPLRRPYHGRKVPLYDSIDQLLERRHALIHHLELSTTYSDQARQRDFADLGAGIRRVYEYLLERYGWASYDM